MAKEHEPHEPKHRGKVEAVEYKTDPPDPEPGVAKMVREKGADGKNLDKPPVAPVAGAGPLPRLIHQNARAPEGCVRFKIHCVNYHPQPVRYILCKKGSEAKQQAKDFYLHSTRLDAHVAFLEENAKEPDKVDRPQLSVTELPD